jgi:surfactin synthase thioesterase subunit
MTGGAMTGGAMTGNWVTGQGRDIAPHAAVRLFCFAHAGGGAAFFRPWRLALAPEVDVRPILLPGRESRVRELPYRRMEQLLDPLCAALEPYLDRPYALFGHSLGSIIAYEVARRLSAGPGPRPSCLMVSGRRAPRQPARRRQFGSLPEPEFLAAIAGLNGTPPEVLRQPQLLTLMLPALRADFELNERYQPLADIRLAEPPLGCPVTAYMGLDDPEVDPGELLAWHTETSAEFTMRTFAGDHFYLRGGRPEVLSAIAADLARAAQVLPPPRQRRPGECPAPAVR